MAYVPSDKGFPSFRNIIEKTFVAMKIGPSTIISSAKPSIPWILSEMDRRLTNITRKGNTLMGCDQASNTLEVPEIFTKNT